MRDAVGEFQGRGTSRNGVPVSYTHLDVYKRQGRQYTSLRKLFAPVADCCVFLCDNGGVIYKDEQCIAKNPMPRALAEEIANDLWTRSDGQGEVMLSGQNTAYLMERGLGMLKRIQLCSILAGKHHFALPVAAGPQVVGDFFGQCTRHRILGDALFGLINHAAVFAEKQMCIRDSGSTAPPAYRETSAGLFGQ